LSFSRRLLPIATLAIAISALYLYKLDGVGILGRDEPRYAAIGTAMAQTGDLVTPRLWGSPWFEKPPLLYWMTAAGTITGLNRELSARLPVTLLSLAFLAISFALLRREFGTEAAAGSLALLATSAGWVTYSDLCLTDLPLAAFFSLAVFAALPMVRDEPQTSHLRLRLLAIGACLGLAALSKGLVPVVLSLPFLWFLRRFWRSWWVAFLGCFVIALPWYAMVYLRNGYPFIQDFFLKQHVERLYSPSLQHVQPWYYYFPVLLAGLFPWTPLLALLLIPGGRRDNRRRFLAVMVIFGFAFFSISRNKLPGYLLPLIPSLFALIGSQLEFRPIAQISRFWWLPCAFLIAAIPLIVPTLPLSLSVGHFSAAAIEHVTRTEWFYIVVPIAVVLLAKRSWVGVLLVLCVVSGGIYLKDATYPVLDREVSARSFWQTIRGISNRTCDGGIDREWLYGLSYYRGSEFPPCDSDRFDYALKIRGRGSPVVEPLK
jgi:4-amino-4-deoxy-L-arabinose transferase-like glycosyltransferase